MVVHDYDPPQEHSEEKALLPEGVELESVVFREGDGLLDGILLPIEPEGTAIEGSTWGRIKASLKVE